MKLLLIIFSLLTLNLSFAEDGDQTPANASQCDTDRGTAAAPVEDSPETGDATDATGD